MEPDQITLAELVRRAAAIVDPPGEDAAVESARALRAHEPSRLATGHGRVVEQPLAAMDEALRRTG